MLQASFVTCEAQSSDGIERLSSLEVKPGEEEEEEEVRWGEGGDGRQRGKAGCVDLPRYRRRGSTDSRLTGSSCCLQCHGNGGAGWPDLRVRRIRWKLIPQLRGVLFSGNKQVRALPALQLIRLFAARVAPCCGTAGSPGCKGNTVNEVEKLLYLDTEQCPSLQEFTGMQANKTVV